MVTWPEFTIEMLEDPASQIERYTRSSREGLRDWCFRSGKHEK